MSDNFKIIAVGGAGVNIVRDLTFENQLFVNSSKFHNIEDVYESVNSSTRTEKSVIVASPAGVFSSIVLPTICDRLHSRGEKVFLVGIMPFFSESSIRKKRSQRTLKILRKSVDTTVIVENENFVSAMGDRSISDMFKKINQYVEGLIKDFVSIMDRVPDQRTVGMFRSEGETVADLEKNMIFTSNMKSEGMIGIANTRNNAEYERLQDYFPVDLMHSKTGSKLAISGVTLNGPLYGSYNQMSPSEPCFHTETELPGTGPF